MDSDEHKLERFAGALAVELAELSGGKKRYTVKREGAVLMIICEGIVVADGKTRLQLELDVDGYVAKHYPNHVPF
jgi:hypothetical protein